MPRRAAFRHSRITPESPALLLIARHVTVTLLNIRGGARNLIIHQKRESMRKVARRNAQRQNFLSQKRDPAGGYSDGACCSR
jgi:hypothetical protein